jgi:hypothetical protein
MDFSNTVSTQMSSEAGEVAHHASQSSGNDGDDLSFSDDEGDDNPCSVQPSDIKEIPSLDDDVDPVGLTIFSAVENNKEQISNGENTNLNESQATDITESPTIESSMSSNKEEPFMVGMFSVTKHWRSFESHQPRVIGPKSQRDLSCPCCKQSRSFKEFRGTLNEPKNAIPARESMLSHLRTKSRSARSLMDDDDSDPDGEGDQLNCFLPFVAQASCEDEDLPGSLGATHNYTVRKTIVEGWLHKKGTGNDWLCSRSWKPRWTRLVVASLEGYEADVPLLIVSWFPTSKSPSNGTFATDVG